MTANQPNLLRYSGTCMPTANIATNSTTASASSLAPESPKRRLTHPKRMATNVNRIEIVPAAPPA